MTITKSPVPDCASALAAAGEIEAGAAAEFAASAMTRFGLSSQDITHIADLLSAANTDMQRA